MENKLKSTIQVYAIGNKSNVQDCVAQLIGRPVKLHNMWTSFPAESISKGTLSIERLKEHGEYNDMNKALDIHESGLDIPNISSFPQKERPSPLGMSSESVHTKEYANMEPDDQSNSTKSEAVEDLVDVDAIVVEENTGINAILASFVFNFFSWPALILLAIDGRTFDMELYEVFVKEMGVLASYVKATSKLLVVDINPHRTEENQSNHGESTCHLEFRFQPAIRKSYFSSRQFKWCKIHEMNSFVKSYSKETCTRYMYDHNTLKKMFAEGQLFYDVDDKGKIEPFVRRKQLILFKTDNEYVCMPDVLINKFRDILSKLFPLLDTFRLQYCQFSQAIGNTSETDRLIDVLSETHFIQVDEDTSQSPFLSLLPFINDKTTRAFDQNNWFPFGKVLRLTIKLDIIPAFIRSKIYNAILSKGWEIFSLGPANDYLRHSMIFCKKTYGILVGFSSSYQKTSNVYLLGLTNSSNCSKEKYRDSDYQEIRETVESKFQEMKEERTEGENFVRHYVKVEYVKRIEDVTETKETGWKEIGFENSRELVTREVSPWFLSEKLGIERKLAESISNDILAEISNLFGKGTFLFFVSEKIPPATLSQMEKDNKGETKEAILNMLIEWRKQKGPSVTIGDLRSAIQKSTHIDVNQHEFDQIVLKQSEKK